LQNVPSRVPTLSSRARESVAFNFNEANSQLKKKEIGKMNEIQKQDLILALKKAIAGKSFFNE